MCLDAEQRFHVQRELVGGDSARIASLGFVDDLFYRYGHDPKGRVWPRAEAVKMLRESRSMYPAPLTLE